MKQDRNGVRTAQDLERKYDLKSLAGIKKAVKQSVEGINKTNTVLENFINETVVELSEIHKQLDGNITTHYYSGVPTLLNPPASEWAVESYPNHIGDLYYDKETGYAYRFVLNGDTNKYEWIELMDNDVAEALAIANAAKDTADGKRRVFVELPKPPYDVGDLWLKDEELYVCKTAKATGSFAESDFEKATKYTDDASLNQFVNVVYTNDIQNLKNQIDGKVTTWYFSGMPTLSNAPAKDWSTEEKLKHIGDLYYDKDTGRAYLFEYENNAYSWNLIKDQDITQALALANAASDTADSKRRVFVSTPVPPYDNGDLWFNNQEIYICQISKAEGQTYATNDFIIATKYTDDTVANQVGDNLEIVRGTVATIKEGVDAVKIEFETTTKTIDSLKQETTEAMERMSYTFGTKDLSIANSNDPVNTRINNQGLKVYNYQTLQAIFNHRGTGVQKLIVTGDAQLANISIVKAKDENGNDCTDINHLVSNIQTLADLEGGN